MEQLIQMIARSLVDSPEQVSVKIINSDRTTIVELCVATEDIGKVIGKQGRTANALRTILNSVAAKDHKRMVLEILEPGKAPDALHRFPDRKSVGGL